MPSNLGNWQECVINFFSTVFTITASVLLWAVVPNQIRTPPRRGTPHLPGASARPYVLRCYFICMRGMLLIWVRGNIMLRNFLHKGLMQSDAGTKSSRHEALFHACNLLVCVPTYTNSSTRCLQVDPCVCNGTSLSHGRRAPIHRQIQSRRVIFRWDWCDRFECLLERLAGTL